ncbi:hypothetical protein [Streptomyces acidiscabies]|uniref:hypothetical protein n=1 Tax=Streptomyces acidiscabies TaxID=42234 RepID=UPI0038F79D1E
MGEPDSGDGDLMWRVQAPTILVSTLIGSRTAPGVPGNSQYAATKAAPCLVPPGEVAALTAFLLGPEGGSITGR